MTHLGSRVGWAFSFVFFFSVLTIPKRAAADSASLLYSIATTQISSLSTAPDNAYAKLLGLDSEATVHVQYWMGRARHSCTGTFLNDTDVVAAAHCVVPLDPTGGVSIDGIESLDAIYHADTEELI